MLRTELKELPPIRRSKYDSLLEAVDGNVVVLLRGEDFDSARETKAVRADLARWARSRGVRVSARVCWDHPETGEASPFEREGKPLPWGLYVKVRSRGAEETEDASPRPARRKARAKKRR